MTPEPTSTASGPYVPVPILTAEDAAHALSQGVIQVPPGHTLVIQVSGDEQHSLRYVNLEAETFTRLSVWLEPA